MYVCVCIAKIWAGIKADGLTIANYIARLMLLVDEYLIMVCMHVHVSGH